MPKKRLEPTYQLHKASGQARTIIDGKSIYLGLHGTAESQARFNDLKAEWRLRQSVEQYTLTIDELALRYLAYADAYYRHKDGTPTRTAENIRYALRPLVALHGLTRVRDFGPRALKAVREKMIAAGHSRTYINSMVGKIKQVFRWGLEEEFVPSAVYEALKHVAWLKKGRSLARETELIQPVAEGTVSATLPYLPRVVADMVRLQLLCGARPGEICALRPGDVTRGTNGVWIYRPASHKTEHHGRERRIFIGPEGQSVLTPYLDRDPDAYCFSPAEAEAERSAARRAARQTPLTPSQAARNPKGRQLRDRYVKDTYNRAIARGCESAFGMPAELRYVGRTVARMETLTEQQRAREEQRLLTEAAAWRAKSCWSPNQLRHTRATAIREQYGLEAAQTVLGHSDPRVTEIYAERDFAMAARIMQAIG